jgi:hypothetical protein
MRDLQGSSRGKEMNLDTFASGEISIVPVLRPKGAGWSERPIDPRFSMGYPCRAFFHAESALAVMSAVEVMSDEDKGPEYHISISKQKGRPSRCDSNEAKWVLQQFGLEGAEEDNHVHSGIVRNFGDNILDSCSSWPHNIWAVTGFFALFLLLSACAYATRTKTGYASAVNAHAALTKSPLWEARWLSIRLNALAEERKHTNGFSTFTRQEARSLPKWNFPFHLITTSSKSSFRTKLRSRSISNPASKSPLSLSIGSLANTNPFATGDLFTASNNFSNIKPEPAERRVLSSRHNVTGWLVRLVLIHDERPRPSVKGHFIAGVMGSIENVSIDNLCDALHFNAPGAHVIENFFVKVLLEAVERDCLSIVGTDGHFRERITGVVGNTWNRKANLEEHILGAGATKITVRENDSAFWQYFRSGIEASLIEQNIGAFRYLQCPLRRICCFLGSVGRNPRSSCLENQNNQSGYGSETSYDREYDIGAVKLFVRPIVIGLLFIVGVLLASRGIGILINNDSSLWLSIPFLIGFVGCVGVSVWMFDSWMFGFRGWLHW